MLTFSICSYKCTHMQFSSYVCMYVCIGQRKKVRYSSLLKNDIIYTHFWKTPVTRIVFHCVLVRTLITGSSSVVLFIKVRECTCQKYLTIKLGGFVKVIKSYQLNYHRNHLSIYLSISFLWRNGKSNGLKVSEFEFQSRRYVYIRTSSLGKGMNPLIHPAMDKIVSLLFFNKDSLGMR